MKFETIHLRRNELKIPRRAYADFDDEAHARSERTSQSATARHWARIYERAPESPANDKQDRIPLVGI